MNSWLSSFMFILQDRVKKNENLDDMFAHISVVNFNYDRCLEHFLWFALQQVFLISADKATQLLNSLPVYHPYGTVGALPWQGIGVKIRFGEQIGISQLIQASASIRTFNEQIEEEDMLIQIGSLVSSAERMVFLGSHYHEQNMEVLRSRPPGRGGVVDVYGTAYRRSASDIRIIDGHIRGILSARGGTWQINLGDFDCNGLFQEFGTALAR
jgi:hypothetical protein